MVTSHWQVLCLIVGAVATQQAASLEAADSFYVKGANNGEASMRRHICGGKTKRGRTSWSFLDDDEFVLVATVNMRETDGRCLFSGHDSPALFATIVGADDESNWMLTGGHTIYDIQPDSFKVIVYRDNKQIHESRLNLARANQEWTINWVANWGKSQRTSSTRTDGGVHTGFCRQASWEGQVSSIEVAPRVELGLVCGHRHEQCRVWQHACVPHLRHRPF
jgi:hypothetical protein